MTPPFMLAKMHDHFLQQLAVRESLGQGAGTWLGLYQGYKCQLGLIVSLSFSPSLHHYWFWVRFGVFYCIQRQRTHTPHSSTHYIHYLCHYYPHLMLFVDSYVVQITIKHFHWHLNADLSPLFVTYTEPFCDKLGLVLDKLA